MLDQAITDFFTKRKEDWLKKKTKPGMTEDEIKEVEAECEKIFSLENWLPNAAKRAGQISISTHPCTFSHPGARKNKNGYVTPVIANCTRKADGYLRSGNLHVEADALGNAAALDVYKFLSLKLADGKTLIEHIEQDTELSKSLLTVSAASYEKLKTDFLEMISLDETMLTSSKIKQVYFPVDDDYHQLSILSNSGIIFELRKRIDEFRFSDAVKVGRELRRNNHYSEVGYSDIYNNVATIGYGGTKPQNISVLNNQNGGKAHLLLSAPPILKKRKVNFPTKDFFIQSLRYFDCKEIWQKLHNIFKIKRGDQIPLDKVCKGRDCCFAGILGEIVNKMTGLREVSADQFYMETTNLPTWQQIWLCEQYKEQRCEDEAWLNALCERIAIWIPNAYKKSTKHPVMLGEAERLYIKSFINKNREVFR